MKLDLDAEKARADNAERAAEELKKEVEELKKHLSKIKYEAAVIAKFKKSQEYDEAIANAGAPEVQRYWVVF